MLSIRHRRDKTMAGYAPFVVLSKEVDLDHVTTRRQVTPRRLNMVAPGHFERDHRA